MEVKEMFKKYFRSPMAKMILNNGSTKDAKAGNGNKQRHKKPRQPKKEGEAAPMVSTKYSKTAGMSPVVNPSKDSTLKQILKKPLSWIKKLGK